MATNSCSAKSTRYGLMIDNMRAIDAIPANGTPHRFGPVDDNLDEMSAPVAALVQRQRTGIRGHSAHSRPRCAG